MRLFLPLLLIAFSTLAYAHPFGTCTRQLLSPEEIVTQRPGIDAKVQAFSDRYKEQILGAEPSLSARMIHSVYPRKSKMNPSNLLVPEAMGFVKKTLSFLDSRKKEILHDSKNLKGLYTKSQIDMKDVFLTFDAASSKGRKFIQSNKITYNKLLEFTIYSSLALSYLPEVDFLNYHEMHKSIDDRAFFAGLDPALALRKVHSTLMYNFSNYEFGSFNSSYEIGERPGRDIEDKLIYFIFEPFTIEEQNRVIASQIYYASLSRTFNLFDGELGLPIELLMHDFAQASRLSPGSFSPNLLHPVNDYRAQNLETKSRIEKNEIYSRYLLSAIHNFEEPLQVAMHILIFEATHEFSVEFNPEVFLAHFRSSGAARMLKRMEIENQRNIGEYRRRFTSEDEMKKYLLLASQTIFELTNKYLKK